MRAIRVREPGGPEALEPAEIDVPTPGHGAVRVRVAAAGLNFIDVYHRRGLYPRDLPFVPGMEAAGEVDAVGDGVEGVAQGDRVAYAMHGGAYAEYAVVPADLVVTVPDGVETRTAAAVMLQGMTAHYLTHSTFALGSDHTVLVHAAAGGVGHLLTQIAHHRGAQVVATVSTARKERLARETGADEVIRYDEVDFAEEIGRRLGTGPHVVYDGVGAATFRRGLECLRHRGTMVLYGAASGPVEPLDPQELNRQGSLFLTRPSLGHYVADRSELEQRARDLFAWISDGWLQVRIDRTFALEDAAEAHRYIEERRTHGKVLLVP